MKKWNVQSNINDSQDLIQILLENRGITTKEERQNFLNPPPVLKLIKTLRPQLKKGLLEARKIILESIKKEVPIVIHGDYDADGICATTILYNTIKNELNYENIVYFIPNRFDHGYGLSKESINASINKASELVGGEVEKALFVTVDSGITCVEEAKYIKELGHELIITDHHQKPEKLPKAQTIVWEDQVVGSSIAWFLSKALGSKNESSLCLAALATVTDIQPVIGLNRSIVKEGLEILNTKPPIALQALIDVAGKNGDQITTYHLGWVIGPRLNASGRIIDASQSIELLLETDYSTALKKATALNKVNIDRQDKTMEMFELADDLSEEEVPKILISYHEDYHEGIIGLVASRLVKTYYRPAIVISLNGEEGKGSVRSVKGINIIQVLREFQDLFVNVGGHPLAAGFTIEKKNIPVLEEKLLAYSEEYFKKEHLIPEIDIDAEIPVDMVDLGLFEKLEKLKPFGVGNKEPFFVSRNLGLSKMNFVGRMQNHVSFSFYKDNTWYKGIYFSGDEHVKAEGFKVGDLIDVVYKLNKNVFNGNVSVDLVVKDMRLSKT